jgi:hypothetical protein
MEAAVHETWRTRPRSVQQSLSPPDADLPGLIGQRIIALSESPTIRSEQPWADASAFSSPNPEDGVVRLEWCGFTRRQRRRWTSMRSICRRNTRPI